MSPPVATESAFAHNSSGVVSSSSTDPSGTVIVIGSMATAQSGAYQKVVESYAERQVEMHLVDRITDGATTLAPSSYPNAHLVAPYSDVVSPLLLSTLYSALQSNGNLVVEAAELIDATAANNVRSELAIAGFSDVRIDVSTGFVTAVKPNSASASFAIGSSSALPLRKKAGGANGKMASSSSLASKKALWSVQPASSDLIDQSTLLQDGDFVAPTAVKRPDCDVGPGQGKKKKACKGCTCGLRELQEEEEQATNNVVQLDESDMDMPAGSTPADAGTRTEVSETIIGKDGKPKTIKRIQVDTKGATSSCGSCFLGDAFRCSSCPYLGLPAFEPGQKVQIPLGMDDDV